MKCKAYYVFTVLSKHQFINLYSSPQRHYTFFSHVSFLQEHYMWSFPSHTEMCQNGSLDIPDKVQVYPTAEKNFPIFLCFTFRYMYGVLQNSVESILT